MGQLRDEKLENYSTVFIIIKYIFVNKYNKTNKLAYHFWKNKLVALNETI